MRSIIIFAAAFLLGLGASQVATGLHQTFSSTNYNDGYEIPSQVYAGLTGSAIARAIPGDHVKEEQIMVYKDRVVLDVQDAIWAKFTPTRSMEPVLSHHANAIEVIPKSPEQIQEGDIIAYTCNGMEGTIIHRVIRQGEDQLGTYYIAKGDNNPVADPCKIRFEEIKSVVVAIIY